MNPVCRICSNGAANQSLVASEKMFGLGDTFAYFVCAQCGCLQISEPPREMTRFYPPHYYSFHLEPVVQSGMRARIAAVRDRAVVSGRGLLGLWLAGRFRSRVDLAGLGRVPLTREMRILDVGCGRGQLLSILYRAGFPHLSGIDPYLPADVEVVPGLKVRKLELTVLREEFDLIMMHHVFEHIEEGRVLLAAAADRLRADGKILLRLPTVDSEAWKRYRENWVQLDAPRHLFLHSRRSLRLLAEQAGLEIIDCWCDSSAFQFLGSELYRKGLPLISSQGKPADFTDHFTPEEIRAFERAADRANQADRGDQLAVILRKPKPRSAQALTP